MLHHHDSHLVWLGLPGAIAMSRDIKLVQHGIEGYRFLFQAYIEMAGGDRCFARELFLRVYKPALHEHDYIFAREI